MRNITLLGASGSIGTSTLRVLALHRDEFRLHAAAACTSVEKMVGIIRDFSPDVAAMADPRAAAVLRQRLKDEGLRCEVLAGEQGVEDVAGDGEASLVIAAIVGAAGLRPALAAVRSGAMVGLANKEALVMTGQLFFDEVRAHHSGVLPIDSEHSAIFQCLPAAAQQNVGFCDLRRCGVHKILLTGSGGPFRDTPAAELPYVTSAQALAHPVWSMGPKISVDSATMMNKGLEFIEARWLFNARAEDIEVLIHPQSLVHSMVAYEDGAVMAQLGTPDMRTPIARALGFPERISSGVKFLDFVKAGEFSFREPDFKRYPALKLAMDASASGQGATTVLNAANEVAVANFLNGIIGFMEIPEVVESVLGRLGAGSVCTLEEVMAADAAARELARELIRKRKSC